MPRYVAERQKKVCTYRNITLIPNMNTDTAAVKPCASKLNVFGLAKPVPATASVSFSTGCAEAPDCKGMSPVLLGNPNFRLNIAS